MTTAFRDTYYSPGEPANHVGIYLGGGQMINAPLEGKPISVMPVFTGFWGAHYAGGGRPGGGASRCRSC
jgi:cell wall-associated NlpC family hydrolase